MRHSRTAYPRRCARGGKRGFTIISNCGGWMSSASGRSRQAAKIRKMISSYVGATKEFERQYPGRQGWSWSSPQGTLAESCGPGGAGIPLLHPHRLRHPDCGRQGRPASSTANGMAWSTPLTADPPHPKGQSGSGGAKLMFNKTAHLQPALRQRRDGSAWPRWR